MRLRFIHPQAASLDARCFSIRRRYANKSAKPPNALAKAIQTFALGVLEG
jgi:hypothetical protein